MKWIFSLFVLFSHSSAIAVTQIPEVYTGSELGTIFDSIDLTEGTRINFHATKGIGWFKIARIGTETFELSFKIRETRVDRPNEGKNYVVYAESFFPTFDSEVIDINVSSAFAQDFRLRTVYQFSNSFIVTEVDGKIQSASHFFVVQSKSHEVRFLKRLVVVYVDALNAAGIDWNAFRRDEVDH